MKTSSTTFIVALTLAVSLLAVEAQAHGGHTGGSHSAHASASHSMGSLGGSHFSTVQNFHQVAFHGSSKLGQVNKPNTLGARNFAGKLALNKALASKLNKNFASFDFGKGKKTKYFPGKFWWGYGGFGRGGSWCDGYCGNWWPGCFYGQPWYYAPCCNAYGEYDLPDCSCCSEGPAAPLPSTVTIVRITNPLETQTTLGFAVNGRAYSLDAGKTQELQLTDGAVIEFDRGSENATGRYTLSEGAYHFASTPQGWELYANDASQSDAVAAN